MLQGGVGAVEELSKGLGRRQEGGGRRNISGYTTQAHKTGMSSRRASWEGASPHTRDDSWGTRENEETGSGQEGTKKRRGKGKIPL